MGSGFRANLGFKGLGFRVYGQVLSSGFRIVNCGIWGPVAYG